MKNVKHLIRQLAGLAAGVAVASSITASAGTCTINLTANSQSLDGLGFSTAWCPVVTSAHADILFGTASGQFGLSLLRCRIDPNRGWANETGNASAAHARGAGDGHGVDAAGGNEK